MNFQSETTSFGVIERGFWGAICGAVATFPMTSVMRALYRRLPSEERYPLPPRVITMNVARKAGIAAELDDAERHAVTMVAHYGYGAVTGAIYSAIQLEGFNPAIRGIGFGLGVWGVSYLGILPATGLFRTATKQPARRNALMITAHVVWGAVLGALFHLASRRRR